MKQIIFKIITVVIAGIIIFLTYTAAQQIIKYQAIDGCLHAGVAKFKNAGGQNVEVPDGYWYNFCLKEKGLK